MGNQSLSCLKSEEHGENGEKNGEKERGDGESGGKNGENGEINGKKERGDGDRNPTVIKRGLKPNPKDRRKDSLLSTYSTESRHVIEKACKIGAFNIRRFGKAKMEDTEVVQALVQIIRRYDILLVQEIVDTSGKAVRDLLEKVNKNADNMEVYDVVISPRLGRTKSKEEYAFFFKKSRFSVKKETVYEDPGDIFIREPYIVKFGTNCLKDVDDITLIGIHVQPKDAVKEIDALSDVCLWTRKKFKTRNVLILGDLNAGGSYVSTSDWSGIRTRTDRKYHWMIPDHLDTTATTTLAAYDRIIAYDKTLDLIVSGSGNAFRFDQALKLSDELALRISDHYPVEIDLKPSIHPLIEQHIGVRKALVLEDFRYHGEELESILSELVLPHFEIYRSFGTRNKVLDGVEICGFFSSVTDLIAAAKLLRRECPDLISYSLLASLIFHLEEISNCSNSFCDKLSFSAFSQVSRKRNFIIVEYDQ